MAAQGQLSRIELLTQEFSDRGMSEQAAEDLSCHVILHHPLAHKLGIASLTREITARGMPSGSAREVATLLLAFELMNRGANYGTVMLHLERQQIPHGEALAGALDASRIYRQAAPEEETPPALFTYLVAGVATLTTGLIVLAILLQLAC